MADTLHSDQTKIGASFLRKRSIANPQQLVIELVEKYGADDKDDLFEKFDKILESDENLLRAVKWYSFVNAYSYATRDRSGDKCRSSEHRRMVQAAQTALVNNIKEKILGLSLQFIMPNGKRLAVCTGNYCIGLGGNLAKIGKRVGKRRVGDVLTDADLKIIER